MAGQMMQAAVALVVLATPQASNSTVTTLLSAPVPLTPAELATIIEATATSVVGKSFFTYGGFGGATITIGPGPRVRYAYYGNRAEEWSGVPARLCDGTVVEGELALDWRLERSSWRATARASSDPRVLDSMFELWRIDARSVEDAGFRELEGVLLRGLRYPYEPPAGTRFEASWQSVWFDVRTALPARYEIAVEAPEPIDYGYFLAYAPGWKARPGPTTERPDCIQSPGRGR